MRIRDVILSGNAALEVVKIDDGGRSIHVKLVAGEGAEARFNEVPQELLVGKPVYRRISDLQDVDIHRAVAEVSRYVDVDRCGWDPRTWVEEFHRKYPPGTSVPDSTLLLGWFSRLITAGEDRIKEVQRERARDRKAIKKPIKRKAAVKPAKVSRKPRAKKVV